MMVGDLGSLCVRIEYEFKKTQLLELALNHASFENRESNISNERLEFLGDRVFGLIIAEMLFKKFPNESEGDIAKRHTALVRQEALVRVAQEIQLGQFILMSKGEEASGGRQNHSVLANCCEALIAALYLDGGYSVAWNFVSKFWLDLIEEMDKPPQDPKTALQEWAQGKGLPIPCYDEINRKGPPHKPTFLIKVMISNKYSAKAWGSSKQKAEQNAAKVLMLRIIK